MKRMYQVEVVKHVIENYEVEATSQEHAEELISHLDFYNLDGIIVMERDDEGNVIFDSEVLTEEYYYDHLDAVKDNYNRVLETQTAEDFMYINYFQ